jgi:hypothetical protein
LATKEAEIRRLQDLNPALLKNIITIKKGLVDWLKV